MEDDGGHGDEEMEMEMRARRQGDEEMEMEIETSQCSVETAAWVSLSVVSCAEEGEPYWKCQMPFQL